MMEAEKTTQSDEVTTNDLLLSDLPANETESEDIQAGAGAALHLKPITVGS